MTKTLSGLFLFFLAFLSISCGTSSPGGTGTIGAPAYFVRYSGEELTYRVAEGTNRYICLGYSPSRNPITPGGVLAGATSATAGDRLEIFRIEGGIFMVTEPYDFNVDRPDARKILPPGTYSIRLISGATKDALREIQIYPMP